MPRAQSVSPLPHAAPGARTQFMLLVLFLISLQVFIVTSAARTIDGINATLRDKLPATSDTILKEAPPPMPSLLARV